MRAFVPAAAFTAAALTGGLLVAGFSSSASADTPITVGVDGNDLVDEVGGLIRISEPAILGPFPAETLGTSEQGPETQAAPSVAETLTLHSRPGATRTILLDFDGGTVTNRYWNGGRPIQAAAYSRGSDTSNQSFSEIDLAEMQRIWEKVSDDYAAWDVDVTTEDPGADNLARTGASDVRYGVRVMITPTSSWYETRGSGGVAYVDTFDFSEDLPAFVFSANLANGSANSVAEAVSHEAGHTLGLDHDGVNVQNSNGSTTRLEYYGGHGDWAPIMGVGYSRPLTQWSKGEYAGATTAQDDIAIIDGHLTRLPATATGTANAVGPGPSTTEHTITMGGSSDVHVLQVGTGPVTITVDKVDRTGNLVARLTVRNTSGQVIATADPTSATQQSLSVTLPAGTPSGRHTVEVQSIGWAPGTDQGFSSYGSIGRYVLTVDAPAQASIPSPAVPPTTQPTAPPTTVAPTTSPATTTPPTSGIPTTQPPVAPPASTGAGDRLTAVAPRRLLDTRAADAAVRGPLTAGLDTPITLAGVPADATALVVNVTAVAPQAPGYFSLTPCGVAEDARTSALNFAAGRNIANSVIVPVSQSAATLGQICLFSSVPAHALLDVTGWIGADGELSLEQLGSARAVDTRTATGISGRLPAGVRTPVSLDSLLRSDTVGAVSLNVTAIRPTSAGFLTIDGCTDGLAPTSSLNFVADEIRGNNGVFSIGADRQICVTSSTDTHLTIDVTGEFGTAPGLTFVPKRSPERILDTRNTGRLSAGGTTSFDVDSAAGANSLERAPVAASVNLTAAASDGGFVTAWACNERPSTSALNPSSAGATANGALIELSPTGTSCLFDSSGGHLIVDLAGWWI